MTERSADRNASAWLLPGLMLAGAVLGLVVGAVLGERWTEKALEPLVLGIRLCGVIFLALLKGLIVPLVVTSVITGITRMGDLRKVGRLAGLTAGYFAFTSFLAVFTGMVVVNLVQPGKRGGAGAAPTEIPEAASAAAQSTAQAVYDVIGGMFPSNLFAAAAEGNILGLIVFSLIFGVVLALEGLRARPLVEVIDVANEALLRLVRYVIWLAPIGIFGLVADRIGKAGGGDAIWSEVQRLGWYALAVMLALSIHALVTLPLLLRFLGKRNPARYAGGMADSLITAVGTASSAATMPITLRCVMHENGVSRRAADLVIPLGTTVNMDGTALYEAVAVIFIAQTMGLDLSLSQQLVILVTATLAAVGAAAIPEAGLVTMVIVLGAVGLPAEGIGLLLSIDWVLDRFRTGVNVWGDSVGAGIIDRFVPPEPAAEPAALDVAGPAPSRSSI